MRSPIYFPILRAKAGEIEAIGRLSPTGHAFTRPMLDFPIQRPKDRRSFEHYFAEKIREIVTFWGTTDDIYLDFSRYGPDVCLSNGQHIVDYVFDISRQLRLKSLPVIAPLSLRGPGVHYFEAVSRVAVRDRRGMALRIPYEDFESKIALERTFNEIESLIPVASQEMDIYLDVGSFALIPEEAREQVALAKTLRIAAKVALDRGARRVVFAASSMPDSLTRHKKGEVLRVPRAEFRTWRSLVRDSKTSFLIYGDYGVVFPGQVEPVGTVIPPSRIRVSTEDEYVLYKGGRDEIRSVSTSVVKDGGLSGSIDSWGVRAVRECAAGYGNVGRPTDWVARDTNMHIENTIAAMRRHIATELSPAPVVATPWLQDSLELSNK